MTITCPGCNAITSKNCEVKDKKEFICDLCMCGFSVTANGSVAPLLYHKVGKTISLESAQERGYPTRPREGEVILKHS